MSLPVNCLECTEHQVSPDPDPYNVAATQDNVKVCCMMLTRYITISCTPSKLIDACKRPRWCPLVELEPERKARILPFSRRNKYGQFRVVWTEYDGQTFYSPEDMVLTESQANFFVSGLRANPKVAEAHIEHRVDEMEWKEW